MSNETATEGKVKNNAFTKTRHSTLQQRVDWLLAHPKLWEGYSDDQTAWEGNKAIRSKVVAAMKADGLIAIGTYAVDCNFSSWINEARRQRRERKAVSMTKIPKSPDAPEVEDGRRTLDSAAQNALWDIISVSDRMSDGTVVHALDTAARKILCGAPIRVITIEGRFASAVTCEECLAKVKALIPPTPPTNLAPIVEQLREALEKTTKGEWLTTYGVVRSGEQWSQAEMVAECHAEAQIADAAFIALAHNSIGTILTAYAALAEERDRLREANEWQDISSAPKDGTAILLLSKPYEMDCGEANGGVIQIPAKVAIGYWNPEGTSWVDEMGRLDSDDQVSHLAVTGSWFSGGGWFQPNEVSHWRPLPSAPTTGKETKE